MKISNILQSFKVDLFTRKQVNRSETPEKTPVAADKVQISPEARSLQRAEQEFAVAKQTLRTTPDVRDNRIAEVRTKLKQGVYSRPDFTRELASRLAGNSPLQELLQEPAVESTKSISSPLTPDRDQVISQIRERVASGYYDAPEIRSATADRLLRDFGF